MMMQFSANICGQNLQCLTTIQCPSFVVSVISDYCSTFPVHFVSLPYAVIIFDGFSLYILNNVSVFVMGTL